MSLKDPEGVFQQLKGFFMFLLEGRISRCWRPSLLGGGAIASRSRPLLKRMYLSSLETMEDRAVMYQRAVFHPSKSERNRTLAEHCSSCQREDLGSFTQKPSLYGRNHSSTRLGCQVDTAAVKQLQS